MPNLIKKTVVWCVLTSCLGLFIAGIALSVWAAWPVAKPAFLFLLFWLALVWAVIYATNNGYFDDGADNE